jgi:hypothetical protein
MSKNLCGLFLVVALSSACTPHCHNLRTHVLTWYEYVLDATDRQPDEPVLPIIKSESDPSLIVGDYVLTDGYVYRVTAQSWDNLPRCSRLYLHHRDPR